MADDVRLFVAGTPMCLIYLMPVAECPHCQAIDKLPKGPPMVVTAIDRERGIVTIDSAEEDPEC